MSRRAATRPIASSMAALAALLAVVRPGAAQNSTPPLRGSFTVAESPGAIGTGATGAGAPRSSGGTGLDPLAGAASPARQAARTIRPRRLASRGSRNKTAAVVAAPIRPTLTAPGLAADVQPQLNGVPDAALAAPGPPLRRRLPDDDPYAQLGIRVGGTTLFPAFGEAIGYDSNPNRTSLRRGSFVSQTEGELRVQTDWTRHELTGSIRGAYNEYPGNPDASRPEGAGRLGLRLDVARDTQVNVEGHYQIDTQRPDSPDLNARVRARPVVFSEGGSVGVTQRFNRLVGTIQGTMDRTDYEDARTTAGTVIDQSDRNLAQYGIRGRLGYELSPGFVPFVEALADTRIYDRRIDDAGFRRTSDGIGGRAGTTFEITRLVTGEISAGAIRRSYDDRRLADLTSPIADASLTWTATPLTTIRATAQAGVDETTVPGANGVRVVRGTLEVAHALRRNLTLTAGLTASDYAYSGVRIDEHGFGAALRADYKLTREVGIRASYNYERLDSSLAGSSYVTNVFLVGMRYTP